MISIDIVCFSWSVTITVGVLERQHHPLRARISPFSTSRYLISLPDVTSFRAVVRLPAQMQTLLSLLEIRSLHYQK